jgi:hypothetical protein
MTPEQTIKDWGDAVKKDLKDKIRQGLQFSFFRNLGTEIPQTRLPGIGLEISNIGQLKVSEPVVEVFLRSSIKKVKGEPFVLLAGWPITNQGKSVRKANVITD